jgi:hypothetical protein
MPKPAPSSSANPLRCTQCKEEIMEEGFWGWKRPMATVMKCTIILWPMALLLMAKPDFYECPKCHHKKGSLWM